MGVKKLRTENKKWKIVLASIFLLFALTFESVLAANNFDVVRVGITDNKFQNVLKQSITLYGTAEMELCDKTSRRIITKVPEGYDV